MHLLVPGVMGINQRSALVHSFRIKNPFLALSIQKLISLMTTPVDVARQMSQIRLFQVALEILACLYLNGSEPAMAANISVHQRGVLIQGPIQKGDYARIIHFIRRPNNYERFSRTVFLDSPGGDLAEAIQISHLLDKSHASTFVAWGARCYSACFILWMSGVSRYVSHGATLGVHRIDFKVNLDTMPQTSNPPSVIARRIDNYLSALGTPRVILDKMNATPPTELFLIGPRWLAEQQLLTATSYRPGFIDAAQSKCGPEPFDAAMKDQTPRAHEEDDRWVLQFRNWNDCIDLLRARNQKLDSAIITTLIDQINLHTHSK